MAKSNFIVRGGGDFSGITKGLNKTQKELTSFQKGIGRTLKTIGTVLATLSLGKFVKDSTQAAMQVESSMVQLNRIMGENANEFKNWAKTQSKSYGMAREEAFKYGAVYGNLISSFTEGTKETTRYTTELLKASAVVASATGRTMEDTMERIRSGLLGNTEAIEDLGIHVNVAMLESTEAFKRFANGKSWQQLNFQTQQQIRLMSILEQANKKYGDSLAGTTATRQMMFLATLKNIRLNLGQAFLPIYNIVLPALTTLAEKLESATSVLAQFSQALFGKSQQQATKSADQQAKAVTGVGDAYDVAGKKAKGAVAGFDEVNNLADNSGGGVEIAGGIDPAAMIPEENTAGVVDGVEDVSTKVQEMADTVKTSFGNIADSINKNKEIITSALAGIVAGFAAFQIVSNWTKIVKTFGSAIEILSAAMAGISAPALAVGAAIALLVGNIVHMWQTNEEFRNSVIAVWNQIKTFVTTIATDMWTILQSIWDMYGQTLINNLAGFMYSIQNIIMTAWESFIKPVVTNSLNTLSTLWDKHLKGIIQQIGIFVMQLINAVLEIWNKVIAPLISFMVEHLGPIFTQTLDIILEKFGTFLGAISDIVKSLLVILGGVIDFLSGVFTLNWGKAWNGIKDIVGGVLDIIKGMINSVISAIESGLNSAINMVNFFIDQINKIIKGLNKVPGVNIPLVGTLKNVELPKLANGGITGVNDPFTAIVGDNKTQREVIAPLDDLTNMITSAVSTAMLSVMQFAGNGQASQSVEATLEVEGNRLGRIVVPIINNELQRLGYKTLFEML